jgi:hypothetical protein
MVMSDLYSQAKGGRLSFINNKLEEATDGMSLLAYINGEHEYILFDPSDIKEAEIPIHKTARRPRGHYTDEGNGETFLFFPISCL